jgi:NitT/TauT family transport system permease protein
VNATVLPAFSQVVKQSLDMVTSGEITPHLFASLYRALGGLAIGSLVGVCLGITMAMVPAVRKAVYPLVTLTYALPKSALIPIALLWLGVGDRSVILCVIFGTAVPLIVNSFHGAESVPERQIWSAQSMGARKVRILASVVMPGASPQILTGLRMALPLSFILVISAEMVASFVGVGKYIYAFGGAGNYASMFGAILIVMTLAFVFDQCLKAGSSRLLRWTESEGSRV